MKKVLILTAIVAALVISHLAWSADKKEPKTTATQAVIPTTQRAFESGTDRISYALGVQIGKELHGIGINVNPAVFAQAMGDVLGEKPLAMDQKQLAEAFKEFRTITTAKRKQEQAQRGKLAEANLAAGKAFLAENAKKKDVDVKVLPSGLQYKVIREGTGKTPKLTDKVKTHYRGTLIDGTEFDSSYGSGQPAIFSPDGVIAGWTEALQLMKVGAKWQLFIPPELAYGETGSRGAIPPNATLIFELELLDIVE